MEDKLIAMEEGGKILGEILEDLKNRVAPGIETRQIDEWVRRICLKRGVKPSFLGYQNYPASICVSINDEVVHGIPSDRVLEENDLVSLDLGIFHMGYHTDAAISFVLGKGTPQIHNLINVTKNSLQKGIDQAKVGNHIGDIGFAIQDYVEKAGYSVVRTLVGHGVGRHIHEDPMVPNFGTKGTGPKIVPNMTIAIEPMVSMGDYNVYQDTDGWTFKTDDGSLACHFEHSVYITADKTIILTIP